MAIAADAAGTAKIVDSSGAMTGSITIGSLTNGILVVHISFLGSEGHGTPKLDTSSGAALTQALADTFETDSGANACGAAIWYLKNPPSGSHTLWWPSTCRVGVVLSTWSGVDQTTPIGGVVGTPGSSATLGSLSTSQVAIAGDANFFNSEPPTPPTSAGWTTLGTDISTTGAAVAGAWKSGVTSATMTWAAGLERNVTTIVALNAAGGGGGGGKGIPFLPGAAVARFTQPRRRSCYTDRGDASPISLAAYQRERAAQHRAFLRAVQRAA